MKGIAIVIILSIFLGTLVVGADLIKSEFYGSGKVWHMGDGNVRERIGGVVDNVAYRANINTEGTTETQQITYSANYTEPAFSNRYSVAVNNRVVGAQAGFNAWNLKAIAAEASILTSPAVLQTNFATDIQGTLHTWITGRESVTYVAGDDITITKSHPTWVDENFLEGNWSWKQSYTKAAQGFVPTGDWLGAAYIPVGNNTPTTSIFTPPEVETPDQNNTPPCPIEANNTTNLSNITTTIDPNSVTGLTNKIRMDYNLDPLVENATVQALAQLRAEDLADYSRKIGRTYMSHTTPTYGPTQQAMEDFGIKADYGGENIFVGPDNKTAVNTWFNEVPPNDGHRRNILSENFGQTGVGIAPGYGGLYFVQMFTN